MYIPRILPWFLLIAGLISAGFAQSTEQDSVRYPDPKKAARYALLFPGGGQIYNQRYAKAALVLIAEGLAIWRFDANRQAYKNYNATYDLPRHRYLEKRNKYAWWMGFIYIYGLLDAVVDAHLAPFDDIMEEELGTPEEGQKVNEEEESSP